MRYLLDTNTVSDLVRNPQGKVAQHIRKVGEAQVCTSIIVAAELRYGATKKGSPRRSAQLEAVLGALEVLPFEAPADAAYGLLRTRLEQAADQSVQMTCSLRLRHFPSGTPSSRIMRSNPPTSRIFDERIGCAKPRAFRQDIAISKCRAALRRASWVVSRN
jgi:predicted nucleic acid-binding protein